MLLPSAVLAYREYQQADGDKLREWHRYAGNEYQQSDIPVPRAPELENPADNRAVLIAQQSAGVNHRQKVRWNIQNDSCHQPRKCHLRAEGRAMLNSTLAARAIDHQDAGSQRPSSASTAVNAAIAQMPAPAAMGTQFASFTIATNAPSKKTSVMLQGRIRCSSPMIRPKPGGRCPMRANSSTQKRSAICTAGMRKVVSANPKAASEIQPCCKESTANQTLALVSIPATLMLK